MKNSWLYKTLYKLFCSLILLTQSAVGQERNYYNYNIDNGLPSNHVYCVLKDHHGYLWMGTEKGVVRYNGYEFKIYNFSNGLSNEDVWQLYEDKKDRMWLFSISDKIGYIRNNKFKAIFTNSTHTLYPREIREYSNGIMFLSPFIIESKSSLCLEKNDTLHAYKLPGRCNDNIYDNNNILQVKPDGGIYKIVFKNFRFTSELLSKTDSNNIHNLFSTYSVRFYEHLLIVYANNSKNIFSLHVNNAILDTINIKKFTKSEDTVIHIICFIDHFLYMTCDNNIYQLDSNFNIKRQYNVHSMINASKIGGNKISYFINDTFWGKVISTYTNGIFVCYNKNEQFRKVTSYNLDGYKLIGSISDSETYWWNNLSYSLLRLTKNKPSFIKKYNKSSIRADIDNIIPYNQDSSLLFTFFETYWLNNRSGQLSNFYSQFTHISGNKEQERDPKNILLGAVRAFIYSPANIYLISKGAGFYNIKYKDNHICITDLDTDRYSGLVYDSLRDYTFVYNKDNILIYKQNKRIIAITSEMLKSLGVRNIEKILVDNKYGNIFLKEYDKLFVFNTNTLIYKTIFYNYRLNGSNVFLNKNKIIIAGPLGVLFSSITGPLQFSHPIVYPNTKNIIYKSFVDAQVSDNKVLLKTDKELYFVNIPSDSELNNQQNEKVKKYNFILTYNDHIYEIKKNDTLAISQNNPKLQFDLINPEGNGAPKYLCYVKELDSGWHELNANELSFPQLNAGAYYTLSVIAYDKVWRNNPINIQLYVIPYWWQTLKWVSFFWIFGLLLFALLIFFIVYITNKLAKKQNEKKNKQLELELKSVYSQINPHFISNSLTAAMYFIKMRRLDDAYSHIYKFSHLLRSYITSSRNRLISINDEKANLSNYIELQQTRFNNKFEYEIIIDPDLPQSTFIPSLIVQPIVENAIHHGLLPKEGTGHLKIFFKKGTGKNEILCIIDDDGIGRKKAAAMKEKSKIKEPSYGNVLIKELVNIFNKYEQIKIEINYTDKEAPLSGTIVELKIKDK